MSFDSKTREIANLKSLTNPQPGDYWHEMFCPYFIVVNVEEGDKFRVLSCLGGPNSWDRKDEPNARVDVKDGWHFDYSKSMLVDREWIRKTVTYSSIEGFVADVVQSEKTERIVQEWRKWKQQELRSQIKELEEQWEKFTGWKYLKEEIK